MGKRSEAEAIIRKAAKVKRWAPGHSLMTSLINHFRFLCFEYRLRFSLI